MNQPSVIQSELTSQVSATPDLAPSFNLHALEHYLQQHIAGFAGPLTIKRFKGGQSNPTFLLSTPTHCYVMRSKPGPVAQLLPTAHAVEREYAVQSALRDSAVPVANMVCLCEDEAVIGRVFYVMDFIEGRIFWDQALPGLDPDERGAIYRELNRVIAELHKVDVNALGLESFGKAGNYFMRQIDRWSRQYRASETHRIEAMEQLISWLPQHIPADSDAAPVLVHGDYRIDNLIFHPTEPRVLAVIDWELSTLGHPLADFAYHLLSWHLTPQIAQGLAGLDLAALGIPCESDYIAAYEKQVGHTSKPDWNFYLAYNLFRLAAILQGIAKRVEAGTASSAQARERGKMAQAFAELGWSFALKAQP